MKIIMVVLALMDNGQLKRSEIDYEDTPTLSTLVDCQSAAKHLNDIAYNKRQSSWFFCIQKEGV